MLNIAKAHANMISLFFRFLDSITLCLNLNFKTSSNMLVLYSLVCVEISRNPDFLV